ncbi:histidinol-phosphatase [Suttonella ornithocola]|uniref:Histidinol-phosphatase n=1 Tax=Suttonella ornithocola TaxID=279832 RepID=A0A380MXT3_9GAMM|nr:histidinol-phosphatase [Suttonella ornithocola]SUO97014.1 Histidinol-phosphatase [Suttonella ornithocola]
MHHHLLELLTFAEHLADEARKITQYYFRQPLSIQNKVDQSPVTIADQKTEAYLRQLIKETYPTHAIIGEEHGSTGNSPYRWILDPIDGTKSYISGFPIYCTLIALLYQEQPLISLIDMPALNERFTATAEQTTQLNQQPIQTAHTQTLSESICYTTSLDMFSAKELPAFQALSNAVRLQRYTGDGYNYAMLAAGWIDLVVESDMKPYDYLPLILIVKKAGGMITDWHGNSLTLNSKGDILATANPALHQQALNYLNQE